MAQFILNKSSHSLFDDTVISETSQSLGSFDMRKSHGGLLSLWVKNVTDTQTEAANIYILINHSDGATPIVSLDIEDGWYRFTNITSISNNDNEYHYPPINIPPTVQHLAVYIDMTGVQVDKEIMAELTVVDNVESI